ncbi:hypothetical protein FBU31_006872, partial [Coemansia sp. 'formosensis']
VGTSSYERQYERSPAATRSSAKGAQTSWAARIGTMCQQQAYGSSVATTRSAD